MFDRSRYNWAATQVDTCLKFDFDVPLPILTAAKKVMDDDDFFSDVKKAKEDSDLNWYSAMAMAGGQTLANLHNNDHDNVPVSLSIALINASAAAMVMTKGFGVPQAQAWIEEQYQTFGVLEDKSVSNEKIESNGCEHESPYIEAISVATEMFDWEQEEIEHISALATKWDILDAKDIAEVFGISEDVEHAPWELTPMFHAALHIGNLYGIEELKDEIREELNQGGDTLKDLNVLKLAFIEGVENRFVVRYQELVEAVFRVCGWDWDDRTKGNAHFFAKHLDKVNMPKPVIREKLIARLRASQ
jgi:hypothetical protein